MIFYSRHKKLRIALLMPTTEDPKNMFLCAFKSSGLIGTFQTEDKEVIKLLKAHPDFGKSHLGGFTAKVMATGTKDNIIKGQQGYREAVDKESGNLKAKFKEYDTLKDEIVKVDGSYRTDATEEQKAKYEMLKEQIGL